MDDAGAPTRRQLMSSDGTTIGVLTLGSGPAVAFLHGSFESAVDHLELARLLAPHHTVHLIDRRGRGTSGPAGPGFTLATEVADVQAVLSGLRCRSLFGVSSGGLVALAVARDTAALDRVAVFEPPLGVDAGIDLSFAARYRRELRAGHLGRAMATGMLGAQMGPPLLARLPRPLVDALCAVLLRTESKRAAGTSLRELVPTLDSDIEIVSAMNGCATTLAQLGCRVLLLGGTTSPAYLRRAVDVLHQTIDDSSRVILQGQGHAAAGERARGGRPDLVAPTLLDFFTENDL